MSTHEHHYKAIAEAMRERTKDQQPARDIRYNSDGVAVDGVLAQISIRRMTDRSHGYWRPKESDKFCCVVDDYRRRGQSYTQRADGSFHYDAIAERALSYVQSELDRKAQEERKDNNTVAFHKFKKESLGSAHGFNPSDDLNKPIRYYRMLSLNMTVDQAQRLEALLHEISKD